MFERCFRVAGMEQPHASYRLPRTRRTVTRLFFTILLLPHPLPPLARRLVKYTLAYNNISIEHIIYTVKLHKRTWRTHPWTHITENDSFALSVSLFLALGKKQ